MPAYPSSTASATTWSQSTPASTCRACSAERRGREAAGGDLQHRPVEALVGDHQVAAAAEDQQRFAAAVGLADRVDHLGLALGHHQPAGRAAQAQGGEPRERDVAALEHAATPGRRRPGRGRAPSRRPHVAVRSTRTRWSSSFAATLPVTSTVAPSSSSGTGTGRVKRTPYSTTASRVAGPVGDDPGRQRHGEHAVGDHVGQADRLRHPLVPVDDVEVAGRTGVPHQVGAADREGLGRQVEADLDVVVRRGHVSPPRGRRGWTRR